MTTNLRGEDLTLTGVARGTAIVTVIALNALGLESEQLIDVTVTSRTPELGDRMPPLSILNGATTPRDLTSYFVDPEGEMLDFSAVSDDPGIVSLSISGAMLSATGEAIGETGVTITASDGSSEVSVEILATVFKADWHYVNMFDHANLDGDWWEYSPEVAGDLINGDLIESSSSSMEQGLLCRDMDLGDDDWSIEVLTAQTGSNGGPGIWIFTDEENEDNLFPVTVFWVGNIWDSHYRLMYFKRGEGFIVPAEASGSGEKFLEIDRFLYLGMGLTDGQLWVSPDGPRISLRSLPGIPFDKVESICLLAGPVTIDNIDDVRYDWLRVEAANPGPPELRQQKTRNLFPWIEGGKR